MIKKSSIESLLSEVNIVDVVQDVLPLKRKGHNYVACCPFHSEKTPSFSVSASRGIYKCFGCGKGGGAVNFIMEHEQLSYVEAIRWLAKKYNFHLEETHSEQDKALQDDRESMAAVLAFSARFFQEQMSTSAAYLAIAYLQERGFDTEATSLFALGYAQDKADALVQALSKNQYNLSFAKRCGLVTAIHDTYRDIYRNRLIFPLHNHMGKPIGFAARILRTEDEGAKYINSPEHDLYIKGATLYNLHRAKKDIAKQKTCCIVEGYTDVMRMFLKGYKAVVATAGTALTEEQLRLLGRFTRRIILVYDGDAAGIKATLKAFSLALATGFDVYAVLLPNKKDPDDFFCDFPDDINSFIEAEKSDLIDYRRSVTEDNGDIATRHELIKSIADDIALIPKDDALKASLYIEKLAKAFHLSDQDVATYVERARVKNDKQRLRDSHRPSANKVSEPAIPENPYEHYMSKSMITLLLLYGDKCGIWEPDGKEQPFAAYIFSLTQRGALSFMLGDYAMVWTAYKNYYEEEGKCPRTAFFTENEDRDLAALCVQLLSDEGILAEHTQEAEGEEGGFKERTITMEKGIEANLDLLTLRHLQSLQKACMEELKAETEAAAREYILKKLMFINKEIADFSLRTRWNIS